MADITDLTDVVEDAVTFPILTKEVNGSGGRSPNGDKPANAGGGSLTRAAQGAIRDLLGWRYRADDPKGFLAALNKAVELKEVDGHVEYKWSARPFMVQADLGEVTGAQASIYERARVAVEHALPLLDGLKPLKADADAEEMESVRSLVRGALTELLAELGNVAGPRVQRVDQYFKQLLGVKKVDGTAFTNRVFTDAVQNPAKVRGALGLLLDRFGLKRKFVLTVDEERTLTNALIVVDYTTTLFQTWVAQKPYIERGGTAKKFLGTKLVRLSQMLNVIVESVHEAYDAMDSVFFGAEERDVTEIDLNDGSRITVGELLAWVEKFAAVEAPQLIEDSGKDGVRVVRRSLKQLRAYVGDAIDAAGSNPTKAFGSRRVIEALKEIRQYLDKGVNISKSVASRSTVPATFSAPGAPVVAPSGVPTPGSIAGAVGIGTGTPTAPGPGVSTLAVASAPAFQLGGLVPNRWVDDRLVHYALLVIASGHPTHLRVSNEDGSPTGWAVSRADRTEAIDAILAEDPSLEAVIDSYRSAGDATHRWLRIERTHDSLGTGDAVRRFYLVADSVDDQQSQDRLVFFVTR